MERSGGGVWRVSRRRIECFRERRWGWEASGMACSTEKTGPVATTARDQIGPMQTWKGYNFLPLVLYRTRNWLMC